MSCNSCYILVIIWFCNWLDVLWGQSRDWGASGRFGVQGWCDNWKRWVSCFDLFLSHVYLSLLYCIGCYSRNCLESTSCLLCCVNVSSSSIALTCFLEFQNNVHNVSICVKGNKDSNASFVRWVVVVFCCCFCPLGGAMNMAFIPTCASHSNINQPELT